MKKRILTFIMIVLLLPLNAVAALADDEKAPLIIRCSQIAQPGDIIYINGADLSDGFTGVKLQVITGPDEMPDRDKAAYDLQIVNLDDNIIQALLPETLPKGMYCLWVEKTSKHSEVMYINKTELVSTPWQYAYPGGVIAIHGRNLLNSVTDAPDNAKAMLEDAETGEKINCPLSEVAEYYIRIRIPAEAVPGRKYYIHFTNGLGGDAGWSTTYNYRPLNIVERNENTEYFAKLLGNDYYIYSFIPHKNRFDVTDYGAKGDGVTDDTDAIARTMNECNKAGGGIVYFPNGKYVYREVYIPANTLVMGEDKEKTVLTVHESVSPVELDNKSKNWLWGECRDVFWSNQNNVAVYNISLYQHNTRPNYPQDWRYRMNGWIRSIYFGGRPTYSRIGSETTESVEKNGYMLKDVIIENYDGSGINDYSLDGMLIEDCSIKCTHYGVIRYPWPDDPTQRWGTKMIDSYLYTTQRVNFASFCGGDWVENCTLDMENSGSMRERRFNDINTYTGDYPVDYVPLSQTGSESRTYDSPAHYNFVYGCTIQGEMGTRRDVSNDGEGLCNQGDHGMYAKITKAGENSFSYDELIKFGVVPRAYKHCTVVITSGRGAGQARFITDYDEENKTFTIDKPWDVIPDNTATVSVLLKMPFKQTWVNNTFVSDQRKAALMPFTENYDCVMANNEAYDSSGIALTGEVHSYTYYAYIANNYMYRDLDNNNYADAIDSGYQSTIVLGCLHDAGFPTEERALSSKHAEKDRIIHLCNTYRNNALIFKDKLKYDIDKEYYYYAYNEQYTNYSGIILSANSASGFTRALGCIVQNNFVSGTQYGVWVGNCSRNTAIADNRFVDIKGEVISNDSHENTYIDNTKEFSYRRKTGADRKEYVFK